MVKGISKRVVLVKSPPNTLFDEAIFILKEDALESDGVDADRIIEEACGVANNYVHKHCARTRIAPAALVMLGAALTGAAWVATTFFS